MGQDEIIQHLKVMDESISKALISSDVNDLEQFHISGSILETEIPNFKGNLHVPKKLEYLLFHINWKPTYDYGQRLAPGQFYNPSGYKHRQSGQVLRGY